MHFEQVQRKGGWMDYGGNTMEWNPPEAKQGWDVEPSSHLSNASNHDHWNTRLDRSVDGAQKKKTRYDYETFSRGSSSSSIETRHKSSRKPEYVERKKYMDSERWSPIRSIERKTVDNRSASPGRSKSLHTRSKSPAGSQDKEEKKSVVKSPDTEQGPGIFHELNLGYSHVSGLCKPIKFSIFTSFLVKSGISQCFFDETNSVLLCVSIYL